MPKGYVIFTEDIRDQAGINVYAQQAIPTIMQAGGRVLVADDAPELIEGSWHGKRTVVLEFDSVEAARNWYRSHEYQGVVGLRQAAADCNVVIVGGFEVRPADLNLCLTAGAGTHPGTQGKLASSAMATFGEQRGLAGASEPGRSARLLVSR